MSDYYLWRPKLTSEGGGVILSDVPDALAKDNLKLDSGQRIDKALSSLSIRRKTSELGEFQDVVRTYGKWALIVSNKLKEKLVALGIDNIQWIRLEIDDQIEGKKLSFWCGNIVGIVDALDYEKTVIDEYDVIEEMYIDHAKCGEQKIFRLKSYEDVHILVNESIVSKLDVNEFSGLNFVLADGYVDLEAESNEKDDAEEDYVPWIS